MFLGLGRGKPTGGEADFPEGHAYICLDCGHVTLMTHAELIELKGQARGSTDPDAGAIKCESCGSMNIRMALHCPNCGEYFERPGRGRPVCPHCEKPFPPPQRGGD
jgi:DNA-directed RNA polymerase subunit RPC12/RpoP